MAVTVTALTVVDGLAAVLAEWPASEPPPLALGAPPTAAEVARLAELAALLGPLPPPAWRLPLPDYTARLGR